MKIHFVCTGNTFRSRLAEAYLKSKLTPNLEVTSSGVEADKNLNGTICELTIKILIENNIESFASNYWTLTSASILEKQDLIVFMKQNHFDFCINKLKAEIKKYIIWDINDIDTKKEDESLESFAQNTFSKIKEGVDELNI